MSEPDGVPNGFRVLLSEEDEELAPQIVVTHRIEFRAEERATGTARRRRRSVRRGLPWSASTIEDVRRSAKIPDHAELIVTGHRVVFTWEAQWAPPTKPERKRS